LERHVCLLAIPDVRRNREGMREPGHTLPTGNSPPKMLASNLSIYTLQSE
jgi:hypothetical protein